MSNPNQLAQDWEELKQTISLELSGGCQCEECTKILEFCKKSFYAGSLATANAAGYYLGEEDATIDEIERRIIDLHNELEEFLQNLGAPLIPPIKLDS